MLFGLIPWFCRFYCIMMKNDNWEAVKKCIKKDASRIWYASGMFRRTEALA